MKAMGFHFWPRQVHPGPEFYPATDALDIPPRSKWGRTQAACVPIGRPRKKDTTSRKSKRITSIPIASSTRCGTTNTCSAICMKPNAMDDDPDLVVVSFGTPSRVVKTAVDKARAAGMKVGALRLINLWPFPDEHFTRNTKYLSVELNWDGQLVREIQRAVPKDSEVHFLGTCGDLPTIPDLLESFDKILKNQPLQRKGWELEAWSWNTRQAS